MAHDLITSPGYVVIKAADQFHIKTTRPNEMWRTNFTYFKIVGRGWMHLSTVLEDFSRYIIAWGPKVGVAQHAGQGHGRHWNSRLLPRAATEPRCCTNLGCAATTNPAISPANWRNTSRPGR